MFKRERHVRIATILQSLDAGILKSHGCLFGGGTAIVLSHDEYRESLDIDFICSDWAGYRSLRQILTGKKGLRAIERRGMPLNPVAELRADQYGIRTLLKVGETEIKFEIIHEGRILLEPAHENHQICGIATLVPLDMAACKLLANSDRWADSSVYCRDIIDLAMMDLSSQQLKKALSKASGAYGAAVGKDLKKAIKRLEENPGRLDDCMDALKMTSVPKALLWSKIRVLRF